MAITWDGVNMIFTATPSAGVGDSWANAFVEQDFFNVAGQTGVTKPAAMPGSNVYKWQSRIVQDVGAYIQFKNTSHLVEVITEIDNQPWIDQSISDVSYLKFGELVGSYPQDGINILIDDTDFKVKAVVRGSNGTLSEVYLYASDIRSVLKGSAAVSNFGISNRNLVGEIKNLTIEGFKYGVFMNKTNNQTVIDRLQITNSGLSSAFHNMAELLTPPKSIFLFNSVKALEGHGSGTPNIDFLNFDIYNSSTFDIGTFSTNAVTIRKINGIADFTNIYINSNSNPQAIEDCRRLKVRSNPNALVYLEDSTGLNALQVYSGSKLAEALDSSETLIDVDDNTDFADNDVIKVNMEHMLVTDSSVNPITVTRGYNGTPATAHGNSMWIWKVPNYLTLDGSGDISETMPEGTGKDYIVIPIRRWDTTALTLNTFNNHSIKITKQGFKNAEDTITSYPTTGVEWERGLERPIHTQSKLVKPAGFKEMVLTR